MAGRVNGDLAVRVPGLRLYVGLSSFGRLPIQRERRSACRKADGVSGAGHSCNRPQ